MVKPMNSPKSIGGFLGLEPRIAGDGFPQAHSVFLNSGRSALEYVLRATGARHVYVPKYTCGAVIEPLEKLSLSWSFYAVDHQLRMAADVNPGADELLICNNYFGILDGYCQTMAERFGNQLVLDCSQALYFSPIGDAHAFYSPRKFVGVPDGGCLQTSARLAGALDRDHSEDRYAHLVGRIDRGPEDVYARYQQSEQSLSGQPIKRMSRSTEQLLGGIDFVGVREIRRRNFAFLHTRLGGRNRLLIAGDESACPMVYPFLPDKNGLRERLLADKIFVARYWPDVLRWSDENDVEQMLAREILPLPIDQRYGIADMERIVGLLE